MLSATAPSAFARFLSRADSRAAWTGGVGIGFDGLVSFSYSSFALVIAGLDMTSALVSWVCSGISGRSSAGAEEPEFWKREPPRAGFLPEPRVRSTSAPC